MADNEKLGTSHFDGCGIALILLLVIFVCIVVFASATLAAAG